MNHPDPSRRSLLRSILKSAVLVFPVHRSLLAAAAQPLIAQVQRLVEAMAYLGEPFSDVERQRLEAAANLADEDRAIEEIQRVLDPKCLLDVRINPESRVTVERGAARAELVELGGGHFW